MAYNRPRIAQVASDEARWCVGMARGCRGLFWLVRPIGENRLDTTPIGVV
jgi:hypothetical protein